MATTHLVSSHSDTGEGGGLPHVLSPPQSLVGNVTVAAGGAGGGLPLQLTTITVAVPAQMSPNSANAVLNVPGSMSSVQLSIAGDDGDGVGHGEDEIGADDLDLGLHHQGEYKWKYEQPRADKISASLVRYLFANLF